MNSTLNSSRGQMAVTVSGSFHRHMSAISSAVYELANYGIRVLSPADPRIVAAQGEFLFVASDPVRSVRLVQDRHLECIRAADFLWLVCPDGYVGQSACMEVGFAAAAGVPIYAAGAPSDLTLREYVTVVRSLSEALHIVTAKPRPKPTEGILINPRASIAEVHDILEQLSVTLTRPSHSDDAARQAGGYVSEIRSKLALPYVQ